MPNFPIIDTHLNIWDQTRLTYPAFADLGLGETETRKIYRDNGNSFYRLGL